MRHFVIVFLILLSTNCTAQEKFEAYIGEWKGGWKVGKYISDKEIESYELFHEGESLENWTERAGVTTYKTFFSLNVEQIMEQFLKDMRPKYGKAKFTMVDKNVYGNTPYVLFLIETKDYNKTNKPQSLLQHIVKGAENTHVAYFLVKEEKLSGDLKRQWEKFFKSTKLEIVDAQTFVSKSKILPK